MCRQARQEELEAEMRRQLEGQLRSLADNNRRLSSQLDLALHKLRSLEELDEADEAHIRSAQVREFELDSEIVQSIRDVCSYRSLIPKL